MTLALVDATTWVSGFDFSTRSNELSVELSYEELEDTTYGTADEHRVGRSRVAGLEDIATELSGYWESAETGSADEAAFAGLGHADQVVTHSVDGTENSVAYMYRSRKFNYTVGGEIGEVLPFTLGISGSRGNQAVGAARGRVAAARQSVSASGALGSPVNLGSLIDGEYLYAALHVFSAGTSVSIDVESAPDSSFGTVTSLGTIGPLSAAGGAWMPRVAGPISDPWFRFNVTAVTGTFVVAGAIGIK